MHPMLLVQYETVIRFCFASSFFSFHSNVCCLAYWIENCISSMEFFPTWQCDLLSTRRHEEQTHLYDTTIHKSRTMKWESNRIECQRNTRKAAQWRSDFSCEHFYLRNTYSSQEFYVWANAWCVVTATSSKCSANKHSRHAFGRIHFFWNVYGFFHCQPMCIRYQQNHLIH